MDNDPRVSKINGAMLKMIRLDKSQTILNEISTNLLAFNTDYGVFNFELKFSLSDNLYMECKSKMDEAECLQMDAMRSAIIKFMEAYPVIERKRNDTSRLKTNYAVNQRNFKVLKDALFEYEFKARYYIDKYGMDTMYEDMEAPDEY